jgi:pimeloyl-ACP methyl ester carboxylesterase
MSAITIENDLVHYEVLGRGRAVILVHGWLGSWRTWLPTMQQISMKYRAYAVDLWGFGDSGKDATRFGIKDQVRLLHDFMEKLGIPKAALIGHSYGAAICLNFARQFPDRAPRVMLVSTPLFGDVDESTPGKAQTGTMAAMPVSNPAVSAATPAPATSAPIPGAPPAAPAPGSNSGQPSSGSASETLPRNPLRRPNETPEEMLARLQAEAAARIQSEAAARMAAQAAAKPVSPLLPTTIATVPRIPSPPPGSVVAAPPPPPPLPPAPPAPVRSGDNPFVALLSNTSPGALLAKHVAPTMPDLDKLRTEVEKTAGLALVKSAQSLNALNPVKELHQLVSPTLLLHGEADPFLPAPSIDLLDRINRGKAPGAFHYFVEPELRHFPMLEITAKFNRLLMDFLEAADLTNIQLKDQWRRSMR